LLDSFRNPATLQPLFDEIEAIRTRAGTQNPNYWETLAVNEVLRANFGNCGEKALNSNEFAAKPNDQIIKDQG
jgi:hypothetical protein